MNINVNLVSESSHIPRSLNLKANDIVSTLLHVKDFDVPSQIESKKKKQSPIGINIRLYVYINFLVVPMYSTASNNSVYSSGNGVT